MSASASISIVSHQSVIAAATRLRYLPKYSPDLNPIEQAFSKFKALLRKSAERTIPHLSRRIGALMAAFSPQECPNYF
jgi:transposase